MERVEKAARGLAKARGFDWDLSKPDWREEWLHQAEIMLAAADAPDEPEVMTNTTNREKG